MTYEYFLQVLCLLTLVAVPFSLSKKAFKRTTRLLLALCPIVYGSIYALVAHEKNGIFVALIGLWALFFIMANPQKKEND